MLREARRRADLSQRELAARAGVPQSTVARIETGVIDPKASTLRRILRACGADIEAMPVLGEGVDRTLIRADLDEPLPGRLARLTAMTSFLDELRVGRER